MFWLRFTNLCEQKKIKPNAVAKQLGLSNAAATHWKNGTVPNGGVLSQLADYFHVSVDYLLGRTENPRPAGDSETVSDENCVILNGKKKKLSAKEAEQLVKVLELIDPKFFD